MSTVLGTTWSLELSDIYKFLFKRSFKDWETTPTLQSGNGSGIQTNGRNTFRSAEKNSAAKGTVADLCYVPGSIAAKIGSDNPLSTTTPPSEPVTVGVVRTSRPRVCLEAVPVKISGRNSAKEIVTHVSVHASSCLEGLVRELDLNDMKSTSVTIATVNCEEKRTDLAVQLNVKSLEGDTEFKT